MAYAFFCAHATVINEAPDFKPIFFWLNCVHPSSRVQRLGETMPRSTEAHCGPAPYKKLFSFIWHPSVYVFWSWCLFRQFYRVPFPAHSCAGSPRWYALRTLCHLPPQPFLTSQLFTLQLPVALGVRWLGTKSQPARGSVFQRLHALLWESPETEACSALRGVTRNLQLHNLTDWLLPFQSNFHSCMCQLHG